MPEMNVEVAYALADRQRIIRVDLPSGATLVEAIKASGILKEFPEIDLNASAVGVFSQRRSLTDELQPGDRVEIYRPLLVDPMQARRQRAAARKNRAETGKS